MMDDFPIPEDDALAHVSCSLVEAGLESEDFDTVPAAQRAGYYDDEYN